MIVAHAAATLTENEEIKAVAQIEEEHRVRQVWFDTTRPQRLQARHRELEGEWIYVSRNYLEDLDGRLVPNKCDGAMHFQGLVEEEEDAYAPVSDDRIANSYDDLHSFLVDYTMAVERSLGDLLPQDSRPKRKQTGKRRSRMPVDEPLLRADALFTCAGCDTIPLEFPSIHSHWREEHPNESLWRSSTRWDEVNVRWWEQGGEVVHAILRALGLPKKTDMVRLNTLLQSGRLYCGCGDPRLPSPEEMDWAMLVSSGERDAAGSRYFILTGLDRYGTFSSTCSSIRRSQLPLRARPRNHNSVLYGLMTTISASGSCCFPKMRTLHLRPIASALTHTLARE